MELSDTTMDAKDRILEAATRLFASKGFDATRVSEIADAANVTKALIYYYFKSKEDILDHLIRRLMDDYSAVTKDFVHESILKMISDGQLDIKSDRLSFVNETAKDQFLKSTYIYYERMLDRALAHRYTLRILVLESLKHNSKHRNILLGTIESAYKQSNTELYQTIFEADRDFVYSDDFNIFRSFFTIVPIICFASYYDDCKKISQLSDKELRESFLRSLQTIVNSMVSGSEILLRTRHKGG